MTGSSALAAEYRFCRELTTRSGSSFGMAMKVLPPRRRDALAALYAYCRAVDDAVDDVEPHQAPRLIAWWRAEIDRCYRGVPTHPVTIALADTIESFSVPRSALNAILDGVEMDLTTTRYRTFEELRVYCERVASAVGLASIAIFGCEDPQSKDYAVATGLALQLTNILRDLGEDADRDRIYLPLEDLERFGVTEKALLDRREDEAFRRLMAFECSRARAFYREAAEAISPGDRPRLRAAEAMRETYSRILDRIVAADYRVFSVRVRLSRLEKLRLAASLLLPS